MFVDDEDCDVKMSPEGENEVDVAVPSWGSPTTPTSRLESTASDNSPRDVEVPVTALAKPPAAPEIKTDTTKSTVGTVVPITPKVPLVVVSKSTEAQVAGHAATKTNIIGKDMIFPPKNNLRFPMPVHHLLPMRSCLPT